MDAVDIQKKYMQRERTRCEVYQKILEKCFRRIEIAVEQGRTNFIFDVPPWMWGLPIYSMPDAAEYIEESLKKKGYSAEHVNNHSIFIDWTEYLPEPGQIRDMIRWERNTKWKQPLNKIPMPTISSWILDQPILSARTNNFIPVPNKRNQNQPRNQTRHKFNEKIQGLQKQIVESEIKRRPLTGVPINHRQQQLTFPTMRENVTRPQQIQLFIPPPQMSNAAIFPQIAHNVPTTFIPPPKQTRPFLDRPKQATGFSVKEMLEKPNINKGRKIKIDW